MHIFGNGKSRADLAQAGDGIVAAVLKRIHGHEYTKAHKARDQAVHELLGRARRLEEDGQARDRELTEALKDLKPPDAQLVSL